MNGPAKQTSDAILRVLLNVAQVRAEKEGCDCLESVLTRDFEWNRLLELADEHRLAPLLFSFLSERWKERVPPSALERLKSESRTIARTNLLLAAKLLQVSECLSAEDIRHISYKGPLLGRMYYGDCTLRQSNDLDIIVRREDLARTRDILEEMGFRDRFGLSRSQQTLSFRFGFQHTFRGPGETEIDLHSRIVQRFKARSIDMSGIWSRVRHVPFLTGKIPTFSPEDTLVTACLHAGHHGWMHIVHLADVAHVLSAEPNLDWTIVMSHLRDSNTRRLVLLTLHLVNQFWGIPLPTEVMGQIAKDAYIDGLARRVAEEIWPSPAPTLNTSSLRWLLARTAGESLLDRAQLVLGSVLCPAIEDFDAYRLPLLLAPLYPFLRVWRLTARRAFAQK